jgi:putative endonuclease
VASHLDSLQPHFKCGYSSCRIECPERRVFEESNGLLAYASEFYYDAQMYFVYMLKNSANKLYIGVTDNPERRLSEHNSERGAQFTSHIPTYNIVFLEIYSTLTEARKREIQIKKWRRDKKEALIELYQKIQPTKTL